MVIYTVIYYVIPYWSSNPNMVALFLHLLLSANHKDNNWKGIEVKRGQFITGMDSLSKGTGISIQTLRTCLSKLKLTGEVTIKSTNQTLTPINKL